MTGLHNSLAHGVPPWEQSPRKLISLRDMIEFLGYEFLDAFCDLELEGHLFSGWVKEHGAGGKVASEDEERLKMVLARLNRECERLCLTDSQNRIGHFESRISGCFESNFQMIESELSGLRHSLLCDLQKRKFAFIQPEKAKFFEQEDAFGESGKPFKALASGKINVEIKEAANCLAVDLNNAAIFHLMRVVEFGLRALAKDLQVPIPDEDLEYKQWFIIIDQIRLAVKNKTPCPGMSDKEKSETREFYNGVMQEFEGFKDVWRNNIMHTRRDYSAKEAEAAFDRVRDFMWRLATRVSLV